MKPFFWLVPLLASPTSTHSPGFSDFPVPLYKRPIAPVRIVSHDDHDFRTVIRDAAGGRPDFAGHDILTSWGCGTTCLRTVAIDAATGRATWVPFTVSNGPIGLDDPRPFRRDSRLLILRGERNKAGPDEIWDYLIDDGGFHLLRERKPAPE